MRIGVLDENYEIANYIQWNELEGIEMSDHQNNLADLIAENLHPSCDKTDEKIHFDDVEWDRLYQLDIKDVVYIQMFDLFEKTIETFLNSGEYKLLHINFLNEYTYDSMTEIFKCIHPISNNVQYENIFLEIVLRHHTIKFDDNMINLIKSLNFKYVNIYYEDDYIAYITDKNEYKTLIENII